MKRKEILTYTTAWIRLEDTILSQSQKDSMYDVTYLRYLIKTEVEWWLPETKGREKRGFNI